MPAKLSVVLTRKAPAEMRRRQLNAIMRIALKEAAEYWIREFLRLHFQPGSASFSRYSYDRRTLLYNQIKQRMQRVRPWIGTQRGPWQAAPKPVRPFQWSGMMMNDLLKRPVASFNTKAVATTNKQEVVVPLKVSHPLPKDHAWEVGALIEAEFKMMHIVAVNSMERQLEAIRDEITTKLAA